jgi:hypothetical protein
MKQGHKKKFPVLIQQMREQMEETEDEQKRQKEKRRKEEEETEEERKRQKEKRRREEEEREEEQKRQKEKEPKERRVSTTEDTAKTSSQTRTWSFVMPPGKHHFAFLSHKKTNSKTGTGTETLALRVCASTNDTIYDTDMPSLQR